MSVSSDGPLAKTSDAFEHVGRFWTTEGSAPRLRQIGCCTLNVALIQPVLETICQASTPVVPPISEMVSLGLLTVTVQPAPEAFVSVPPGQRCSVATGVLTMWKVS